MELKNLGGLISKDRLTINEVIVAMTIPPNEPENTIASNTRTVVSSAASS